MNDRARVLVTGFDRFGEYTSNSSEMVVSELGRRDGVSTLVLDTVFDKAEQQIIRALDDLRPKWLVMLGLAESAPCLRLEQIALNLDDANAPDNAGVVRVGVPIDEEGPVGYRSGLPLDEVRDALTQAGVPFAMSHDAGGFVCNHAFYVARHHIAASDYDTGCGFIHLPAIGEKHSLDSLVRAVGIVLGTLDASIRGDVPMPPRIG